MDVNDLTWEEPPGRSHLTHLAEVCEVLRTKPGHWARVDTSPTQNGVTGTASKLRRGKVEGVKPGEFEFATRKLDDGYGLWGRYLGPVAP